MASNFIDQAVRTVLHEVKVASLATTRPNGTPHVVPVSFVLFHQHLYFTSKERSVKCQNILRNNHVALSMIGSEDTVLIEGEASIIGPKDRSMNPEIAQTFLGKYGRLRRKSEGSVLVRVTPVRVLIGKLGRKQRLIRVG